LIEEIPNDLLKRSDYFSEHSEAYTKAASVIVNRIIKYFKYRLHNPLLEEIPEIKNCFLSPKWYDENDNKIDPGHFSFSIEVPYGVDSSDFGIVSLTAEGKKELEKAIEKEIIVELYENILSDAQASIFQGNLRRAVLEMAMACELAIKQTYFSKSSPAGLALEFMEDSKNLSPRIRLTSYLTNIAEYALGEKFEDVSSPADMVNIENLFHGRDKVVHRGELCYKSEKDKNSHDINILVLKDWWISVERLLAWLNSKRSAN
jgi:hypothetical protein